MISQTNIIKQTSDRNRQQIRAQYSLLSKEKSAQKLIDLIEQFQLDSKCQVLDSELTYYLVVAYILQNDWLALKHFSQRYHLNQVYERIVELANAGINEELKQFCQVLIPQITQKLKEKSLDFINLQNFDQLIEKAMINFALKTYQKYYVTIDIKTVIQTVGCNQAQILEKGHQIKDGFVEFKQKQIIDNKITQQTLLKKVKNLISVAQNMQVFQ